VYSKLNPITGMYNKLKEVRYCSWGSIKGAVYALQWFTVACLVAWPLYESEVGGGLVLIETSLLFLGKFLLSSRRTASLA